MEVSNAVRASVDGALVFPESLAVLCVEGPDRVAWLNGLVTCDVAKLERERAMYGLVLEKKGKIVADLVLVSGPSDAPAIFIGVPRSRADAVLEVLDHHLIMENCEIVRAPMSMFVAWGSEARKLLGSSSVDFDPSGQGGAAVVLSDTDALTTELQGLVASTDGATAARVAAGVPAFGVDFDTETYPQEASLEKIAVSFTKGCYMGQEVVFMLQNRGKAKRRIVKLALDAALGVGAAGAEVVSEAGDALGRVTSASGALALGMIRAKAHDGARVIVRATSGDVGAVIAPLR